MEQHPSSSKKQQKAEPILRDKAAQQLGVQFGTPPSTLEILELDAFANGASPICVEIFAHIGKSKSGQKRKLSQDMTKLLLAEKLLGKPCRKVIVVCDKNAIAYLNNSWHGQFAKYFDIEFIVVQIEQQLREEIRITQEAQYR
jgi:hypothetical protein